MSDVIDLGPHINMTPEQCLEYCNRTSSNFQDVLVIGYDDDGELITRSSKLSREQTVFLLLEALDYARGVGRYLK